MATLATSSNGMRHTSSFGFAVDGTKIDLTRMVFDKHDLDGNNAITKDEFHEFIYSMGRYMDEQELEAAWTFIELNGDGKIAYHEFSLWWETEDRWGLLNLTEEQKLALYQVGEYFQYYDEDRTGTLDWEQFSNVYQYMYDAGYDLTLTVEECLLQVDTTHDELVNYNEFIVWMVKLGVLESKGIKRTDLSAKDVQSAKKKGRRASFFDATSVFSCNVEEEVEEEEVNEDAAKLDKVHEEIEEIGE